MLHVFPTFAVGGAQARFASLANHLGSRARHIVVSLNGKLDAREKLDPRLDVSFPTIPIFKGKLGALPGARAAWDFMRRAKPDRLITSNWGSIDWALANHAIGLPHMHTEDGFGPEEQDRQLPRRALTRRALLRHSDVVLPSQTLHRIARDTWRLPPGRLHTIPNGIDTARFANAAAMDPARIAALGDGPIIGTIAALRPEKNLARLISAFAILRQAPPAHPGPRQARLVIVGEGAERPALEAHAAAQGVAGHILFAGHSTEPERWLATFDVFALSSDTEQMPLSVLEAMAAGLPVVATDVGDVRRMVARENAPLIVPREAGALADALLRAFSPASLALDPGAANRARAHREYDQETMFARYRALLGLD